MKNESCTTQMTPFGYVANEDPGRKGLKLTRAIIRFKSWGVRGQPWGVGPLNSKTFKISP